MTMKRFLLFLLTLSISVVNCAWAQYNGSGYYRVQNKVTKRYIRVIDNRGSVNLATTEADLGALRTKKHFENVVNDPASVIYITEAGDGYNFKAQGTSSYSIIGYYVKLYKNSDGTYRAYAQHSGLTKYLCDENTTADEGYVLTNSTKTRDWYIKPINETDEQYFAFKPTVSVGSEHYTTIYASFPFTLPAGMTAYYVTKVADGQAVWKEVKDGKVPASTAVYVKCKSTNYADNKVTIGENKAASLSGNLMKGVYFNNGTKKHKNQLAYNAGTMRVLGVMSDGSLGFVTADIDFIPANTAYLTVPANSPKEIKLVSESEFKPNVAVKSVTLSETSLTMYAGDSHTLSATVMPADATDKTLNWSSSNNGVATVDTNGAIKAIAYGKTTITATCVSNNTIKATCEVTVYAHTTGIELSATNKQLFVGESFTLTGKTLPLSTTDGKIEWSVSNDKVIKRNADGSILALAEGVADVIATSVDGGHTAKCTVTVKNKILPESITLDLQSTTMYVGDNRTLKATVLPADATDKSLKWSSYNNKVATVDADGVVTAQGYGKATIAVSCIANSSIKATCEVVVYEHCTGVEISTSSAHLYVGEYLNLTAQTLPLSTTDGKIAWSVSNNKIVECDANGRVKALAEGVADVIATSADGNYTAKCTVTVETWHNVESVTLDKELLTLYRGDSYTLTATILPDNATDKRMEWSSTNNEVATVDADGLIEAVGYGTTTITATNIADKAMKATCEVTVYEHCTGIELSATSVELMVGKTFVLTAHTLPLATTDGAIEWSVSDDNIIRRSDNGTIEALAEGVAEVIAKTVDGGHTAKCIITVKTIPVAERVVLSDDSLVLYVNDSHTLTAVVHPEEAVDKALTWLNDSEAVINLVEGEIRAVGAGKANVIAYVTTNNAAADTCSVVVYEHTTGVELSATEIEVIEGRSFVLTAHTLPLATSDGMIEWSINDENIIKRNNDGTIEALAEGVAEITATSVDGSYTATCVVTVMPYIEPESVILEEHQLTLYVGDYHTLSATVHPDDATDQALNWSSTNSDVAIVDENGVIEAVGYGASTITASLATNNAIEASCEIFVYEHCTGVELSAANIELYVGESFELTATTLPYATTDGMIVWSVSDETIIECSEDGRITALAEGVAEVMATSVDGGHVEICEVTVPKVDDGIEDNIYQENLAYKIYNLQGMLLEQLQPGVNIIVYENGVTKKIMVK